MSGRETSIDAAHRYLAEENLSGYLEEHPQIVSEPIEAGDTVPVGKTGDPRMRVDADAVMQIQDRFDEEVWPGGVPAVDVNHHFINDRPTGPRGYSEWEVERDEEGHPLLSDALDRREGVCAEQALTAKIWMDMNSDLDSYLVNGGKVGWGKNGWLEEGSIDPHAYLLVDNPEDSGYSLVDPTMIFQNKEQGEFPLASPVDGLDREKYNAIVLEEGYGFQDAVESRGFVYRP